jgi:hypothetical protein
VEGEEEDANAKAPRQRTHLGFQWSRVLVRVDVCVCWCVGVVPSDMLFSVCMCSIVVHLDAIHVPGVVDSPHGALRSLCGDWGRGVCALKGQEAGECTRIGLLTEAKGNVAHCRTTAG